MVFNAFVAPHTKWLVYFIRKLVLCSLQNAWQWEESGEAAEVLSWLLET